MFVYDDGRILVNYYKHLTAGELEVVYGLAERAFKGGAQACRREHWQRVRKSKARPVGYYRLPFMVRADQGGSFASIIAAAAMPDVDRDLEMLVGSEG
ncbi:hypothetical protein [Gordonia malaquae]|uniref:hypothetical protein n=1 Tax=Gordonia malaquae TaxID=410332 RepID=UPI0030FF04DB